MHSLIHAHVCFSTYSLTGGVVDFSEPEEVDSAGGGGGTFLPGLGDCLCDREVGVAVEEGVEDCPVDRLSLSRPLFSLYLVVLMLLLPLALVLLLLLELEGVFLVACCVLGV